MERSLAGAGSLVGAAEETYLLGSEGALRSTVASNINGWEVNLCFLSWPDPLPLAEVLLLDMVDRLLV